MLTPWKCPSTLSGSLSPTYPVTSGCPGGRELKPGEAQHFAWDDPAGMRKLSWNCLEHSGELGLVKVTLKHTQNDSISSRRTCSF